jgi:hypothetical protein
LPISEILTLLITSLIVESFKSFTLPYSGKTIGAKKSNKCPAVKNKIIQHIAVIAGGSQIKTVLSEYFLDKSFS